MHKVGVFRYEFPHLSESFISRQYQYMTDWTPHYICKEAVGEVPRESTVINEIPGVQLERLLYPFTRRLSAKVLPENLNLIHSHFGPDSLYGAELAKKLNLPHVATFHGYDVTQSNLALLKMRRPIFVAYAFEKLLLNKSVDLFIAVSDFIKRKMIEKGFDESKIVRHYLGVDVELIVPRDVNAWKMTTTNRYILSVGRHVEVKGYDVLLKAFSQLPSKYSYLRLVLVGNGKLHFELQELALNLGIRDRVDFKGALPHQEVLALMRQAEMFVLANRRASTGAEEALGLVFNEASACGIPVIGTNHGGVPETIINGETGLIVNENDPDELSNALCHLLEDKNDNFRYGLQGRDYVLQNFNLKTQSVQLEKIYGRLVS